MRPPAAALRARQRALSLGRLAAGRSRWLSLWIGSLAPRALLASLRPLSVGLACLCLGAGCLCALKGLFVLGSFVLGSFAFDAAAWRADPLDFAKAFGMALVWFLPAGCGLIMLGGALADLGWAARPMAQKAAEQSARALADQAFRARALSERSALDGAAAVPKRPASKIRSGGRL